MYGSELVDRNIRLSAIIFMLVESLHEIRNNVETLEEAIELADNAIELYDDMKGFSRGKTK